MKKTQAYTYNADLLLYVTEAGPEPSDASLWPSLRCRRAPGDPSGTFKWDYQEV